MAVGQKCNRNLNMNFEKRKIIDFVLGLWYTNHTQVNYFYNWSDCMLDAADIIRDSVNEFSRLQNWMLSAKANNDMETYNSMHDRYIELKVTLSSLGVNLAELDKIKE